MKMLEKALKTFKKLKKEAQKARQEVQKTEAAALEAWEAWRTCDESIYGKMKSPEHAAAMEASEKENAAREAEKIARLAARAASANVLNAANNVLIEAIQANPDKFKNPIRYEKTRKAIKEAFGNYADCFSLSEKYSIIYLYYYDGLEVKEMSFNYTDGDTINPEKLNFKPVTDEKTIKKEVRQAAKDAARIAAFQAEAAAKADAIRAKYTCQEVRAALPYIPQYIGSAHDPRFF